MKIYREVLSTERLPKVEGKYLTNNGVYEFEITDEVGYFYNGKECLLPKFWLEPIEVKLVSEEILPVEERYSEPKIAKLNANLHNQDLTYEESLELRYHKALEAAELSNTLLNSELAVYREREEKLLAKVARLGRGLLELKQLHQEYIQQLEAEELKDADERYNLAVQHLKDVNDGLTNSEYKALTLAAYGNTDKEV